MIVVVDYCKGNLKSVERGLRSVGADVQISDNPAVIAAADAIVLPGVGAFADASATMLSTNQMETIRAEIAAGKPFLGICLGEHLLFSEGTEGAVQGINPKGLSVIEGVVDRIPQQDNQGNTYKIPHVGWNSIEFPSDTTCPLLEGVKPGEYFYFTHSFIAPESSATIATTTHSVAFPSVVQASDRVFGVQFHPEKSSDAGALILKNFLRVVESLS